jgi:hypothetical protein
MSPLTDMSATLVNSGVRPERHRPGKVVQFGSGMLANRTLRFELSELQGAKFARRCTPIVLNCLCTVRS